MRPPLPPSERRNRDAVAAAVYRKRNLVAAKLAGLTTAAGASWPPPMTARSAYSDWGLVGAFGWTKYWTPVVTLALHQRDAAARPKSCCKRPMPPSGQFIAAARFPSGSMSTRRSSPLRARDAALAAARLSTRLAPELRHVPSRHRRRTGLPFASRRAALSGCRGCSPIITRVGARSGSRPSSKSRLELNADLTRRADDRLSRANVCYPGGPTRCAIALIGEFVPNQAMDQRSPGLQESERPPEVRSLAGRRAKAAAGTVRASDSCSHRAA